MGKGGFGGTRVVFWEIGEDLAGFVRIDKNLLKVGKVGGFIDFEFLIAL